MSDAKPREECDFSEPWPMFEDESKPWMDYERLLDWVDRMEYQYEVADAFGCSPNTISKHVDRAREQVEPDPDDDREEFECEYHTICGNLSVNTNSVCAECLYVLRVNESRVGDRDHVDRDEFDDMMAFISEVYAHVDTPGDIRTGDDHFAEDEDDDAIVCEDCETEMEYDEDMGLHLCPSCATTEQADAAG